MQNLDTFCWRVCTSVLISTVCPLYTVPERIPGHAATAVVLGTRSKAQLYKFTAHHSTHWHVSLDRSLQIPRNYTFWWHTFTSSSSVDNTQHFSSSLLFPHQIAYKQLPNLIYRAHRAQENSMPGQLGRILDVLTSHRYTTVQSHVLTTRTEVISEHL
jgi:hypothetical protein